MSSSLLVRCAQAAVLVLGAACAGVRAQQIGSNMPAQVPGEEKTYTLTVKSQLVIETVVAKDKEGVFIPGLTAKDFTVTEDGVAQNIRFCEHEQLPTTTDAIPVTPVQDENLTVYHRLARTAIAQEGQANGKGKYSGHRLLALYFDMTTMRPEDQERALVAAQTFIRKQMTSADLVAILRFAGGSVDVLQDFSADRNRLLSILETMIVGEGQGSEDAVDDASSADTGAAFGQDDSEFNIFNTDRQLAALQTAAGMLSSMSEKKALIYFASGLRLNGVDNQAQLHATVDAAIRAGVTFWPVDARGLVAGAPLGDATQGSPGNQGMYTGAASRAITDRFAQSQDTMYSLAADTGGKAFFDNNNLTRGIEQAQRAISDYYIIGYYTTNSAQDGRFRRVKISLNSDANTALQYREGYYANKTFARFNETDKERQLEDALMLGDPMTELTVAMEINYFQLNRAEYFVPIMVKIPGRELALAKRMGAEHTLIDFVCEVKDEIGGATVSNVRDSVNVKLSEATAADLAHQPIEYDSGFTLTPGRYSIKFLARDNETGRIGTFQTSFTIPNLNKVNTRVALSSVVLSSQRVDARDALYNATHGKDAARNDAANPLVEGGRKLIPSVNRVFNTDRELYVYLQAYENDGTGATGSAPAVAASSLIEPAKPLVAFVSLYRDGRKVYDSPSLSAVPISGSRLGVTPLSFSLNLGQVPPGNYDCQMNVLDSGKGRVAFWRGPIRLVNAAARSSAP